MRTYRTRSSLLFSTVVYLVMIFTLAACLIPFIYMLALSISSPRSIINNEVFLIPKGMTMEAYKQIFSYPSCRPAVVGSRLRVRAYLCRPG